MVDHCHRRTVASIFEQQSATATVWTVDRKALANQQVEALALLAILTHAERVVVKANVSGDPGGTRLFARLANPPTRS